MALSNILREPRREITETLIGIMATGSFLFVDYKFAVWFEKITNNGGACPWPLGLFMGPCIVVISNNWINANP